MKIIGTIFLILGIIAIVKTVTGDAPKSDSAAYNTGARIGQVIGMVGFTGVGLWLLLRDGSRTQRPTPSRRTSASGGPPPPLPMPPASTSIPVKIHCGCGQNYAFEVEPVAGRMPGPVTCPACGGDGTEAANAIIAQALAIRAERAAWPPPNVTGQRRGLHPALLVALGAIGLLVLLVAVSFGRQLYLRNRARHAQPALDGTSARRPELSQRAPPYSRTTPPGAASGRNLTQSSKPGSARDAAPVPPDVTKVEVFWGNRWWSATIVRREGDRAYIHYEGWSASYDEWVTPDRLRPRRQ